MSMMKNMRNGINSAGMQFVLIAIIVTFVFWGVGGTGNNNTTMATVNGHRITDTKLNVEARLARSMNGTNMSQDDLNALRLQVLNQMITEEIFVQEAESLGLTVSEAEVKQAILDYPCQFTLSLPELVYGPNKPQAEDALSFGQSCSPWFQDDEGSYDQKLYENWLTRSSGIDDQKFSSRLERQLLVNKLQELVARSVHISPVQIEERFVEENTRIGVSFVEVDPEAILATIEIAETDINAFAEASPESIQTAYDAQLATRFTQKATADTSLIQLLTTSADADPEAIKARLQAIRDELSPLSGEELKEAFAAKAEEVSEDLLSVSERGARGTQTSDELGPDASAAIFQVEGPGTMTEVVQTNVGYELVLVHSLTQESITALDDVRLTLAEELLKNEQVAGKMTAVAEDLQTQWSETGELAIEALEDLDLVVEVDPQVDLAGRNIVGLGVAPEIVAALRTAEAGALLPSVFSQGDSKVIVRVDTVIPANMDELPGKQSGIEMNLMAKAMLDTVNSWQAEVRSNANVTNYLAQRPPE
jgi:peptidyl-prolyl cis-trans isomerase D